MTRNQGKQFFELIIMCNGKPSEETLRQYFSAKEAAEIARRLFIADFAIYTDTQIVQFAKKALEKM